MDLRDNYYFRAYASDNTAGFIVTSETKIIKISFNTSRTAFTYRSEHRSGHDGSSTSDGIKESELKIYINDVLLVDRSYSKSSAPYPDSFQAYEDTVVCAVANKVRVYARTLGTANSNTYRVTSAIDETYYVYVVLSSLTIGSTNQNKNIILPSTASNTGAIKFIKNMDTNYILVTTFADEWLEVTSGNRALIMWQYHCVTLIPSQSSTWSIAGYYSNSIRNTNVIVPVDPPGKIATASIGVNIFNVDDISARQSGDNQVILPTGQSGQMCIVVYAGNSVRKSWGNALSFKSNNDLYGIDKRFNNTNDFPYIGTDEDGEDEGKKKSAGIVFISDGTYWYIVGWYRAWCQGWENRSIVSSTQLTPSSYINFNYTPNTLSSDTYYTLPQYNVNDAGKNYFYIFKSTNVSGGVGIVLSANPPEISTNPPTATTNIFNEGMNIIYRGCCGGKGYQYVWVISYVKPGESRLRWYPILNDYTNNAC